MGGAAAGIEKVKKMKFLCVHDRDAACGQLVRSVRLDLAVLRSTGHCFQLFRSDAMADA